MGILSAHDIKWMEDTVQEVIKGWMSSITIYSKLPLEEQPNYNKLMREFTGDYYCKKLIIEAERKDIVNNMTNDPNTDTLDFGKSDDGVILYSIPNTVDGEAYKPSLYDVITNGDGFVYWIRNIRDRIGETLITVHRFTGNTPQITETEGGITIKDYDWSGAQC